VSDEPGFTSSNNPRLSALRILDEPQFIRIVSTAIANNHGVLLRVAEALKVHRNTLGRWIEMYPELGIRVNLARGEK
jgi:hypothetical protein